jgi:hypothetical protein
MKRKEFTKSFVGTFIGVLIYQLFFDISDPFQNYWLNYLVDIAIMSLFVVVGLLPVQLLDNKLSLFES